MLEAFILSNPAATGALFARDAVRERATESNIEFAHEDAGTSVSEFVLNACGEDEGSFKVSIPYTEWTPRLEGEFVRLVKLSALQRISPQQALRLEDLRASRRILKNRRNPDEIAWEHQKRKATKELLTALQKYAKFHDPANSPWASAKENLH